MDTMEQKVPQEDPVRAQETQTPAAGGAAQPEKPKDNAHTTRVKHNFQIFGAASFLYACLYAFCMYRNSSGVTYPFFVAGSLFYICFTFAKLEISLKKNSIFYMAAMLLLGIATFCTDDSRIIAFNKLGVFLLTVSFLLSTLYETKRWALGKTLGAICQTVILSFGELDRPFTDAAWYCRNKLKKKNSRFLYVAAGLVVTIPIFLVVFLLLSSADAVFRDMAERIFRNLKLENLFLVMVMICFMFLVSYCMLCFFCKRTIVEEPKDHKKGEPLIAIPVATILSLLYLVFSGIQILYLFMGKMQLPAGYTYAEYAREGFFQLLFVSILNLILVLVGLTCFRENRVLKVILTIMSLCTFIMIASSAMRMIIYIRYYYLTFLRILVLWGLAVLFLIFAGVIMTILRERFPLFRYSMTVVTCLYLALAFAHPDYWIARVNVAGIHKDSTDTFFQGEAYSDYSFLSRLSADAAPVLIPYLKENGYDLGVYYQSEGVPEESRRYKEDGFGYYYLMEMRERTGHMTLRKFNVSRFLLELEILQRTTEGM